MTAISRCLKYVQKTNGLKFPIPVKISPNYHPPETIAAFRRLPNLFSARHLQRIKTHKILSAFSTSAPNTMAKSVESQQDGRPSINIRPATLDDTQAIAELGCHVFSVTFGHSVEPHELKAFLDESYSLEAVAKDLSDPNKDTILATDLEGDILGFAMLTRGSTEPCVADLEATVELQRIYLYPKAHGTGTAKALADRLEDMAREQGFKNIWLGVWEENFRARKAYEKWGYKRVGTHDFVVGSVVQTDDILTKQL